MEKKKIGIIGVGNMGGAIVVGLLKSGFVDATDIFVSDRKESILEEMKAKGFMLLMTTLQRRNRLM
jgi:pyrroline-5-carboxylate reductase